MDATRRTGLRVSMASMASMAAGLMTLAGCSSSELAIAPKSAPAFQPDAPAAVASASPLEAEAPAASVRREEPAGKPAKEAGKAADERPRTDRPGLGTEWGETRVSSIFIVPFERADPGSPFASLALNYNDQQGANALANAGRASTDTFDLASGLVTVALKDDRGHLFHGFVSGRRDYVIGEAGRGYTIVLHNHTDHRLEAVLSVDGLDVRDGKTASFGKRGYILDPRADLEIDGFRQSMETVAAFRFGSVRGSHAGRSTGDTRNVGVIGVALFHELGAEPPVWSNEEIRRRRSANPFPAEFAAPPPD